ncbi:portal protein [Pararoseomonas indoligenes]|uniref:Head-tail connector protein n=1 Tax=Roseomonas indoligenes TaxID=2820811 RepID=A0A940MPN2_9PROT|nr:portal protein [Pararoseomonas indoligenes]MBP0491673.1 head-tail connector protein [Pararoseomonas indoligenes]
MTPDEIILRAERALERRRPWEGVWRDCYDHVLAGTPGSGGPALYDGTAADAAEHLAASLLAELTPPWSRWFGLSPVDEGMDPEVLERAAEVLQGHLDQSNFALEMHQAFLDLVVAGTGVVFVEEAAPGEPSALRFTAVPLREAVLEEGATGRLDTVFRLVRMTADAMAARYPEAVLPAGIFQSGDVEATHKVIEAVWPGRSGPRFAAVLEWDGRGTLLASGRFEESPFLAFRWLKAPGETYGRGPVMKALPDIRTANKVVELVLKNASIAATGIWQADDDGVLNPATVRLEPGSIIPKAVGSAGLTPLAAPGSFDVSQLVLTDMRARIRAALLADRLSVPQQPGMTATEVLERSAETARLLGATYGRLQAELLTPLVARCLSILRRRGEVPPILLDGAEARIAYQSPLARVQGRADASNTLLFLQAVAALGPGAAGVVDLPAAARHLARTLAAPAAILAPAPNPMPEQEPSA